MPPPASNGCDDDYLQQPHPTPGCEWCRGEGFYGVGRTRSVPATCWDCQGHREIRIPMDQEQNLTGAEHGVACCNMDSNCMWCSGTRGWIYAEICGRCAGSGEDPTQTVEEEYIETVRCPCFGG